MREHLRGYAAAILDGLTGDQRAEVGSQLSVFTAALERDEDLRFALTDPSVPTDSRRSIARDLLSGRAAEPTTRLATYAVATERPSELQGSLEWLTRRSRHAEQAAAPGATGRLATRERLDGYATAVFETTERSVLGEIEDELFRFARTVEASDSLRPALTDLDIAVEVRRAVVSDLLRPSAQPPTVRLAEYAVSAGRARDYVALLDWLVEKTAAERNLRVAEVRSAADLEDTQLARLAAALGRLVGREVELRLTVDPELIGGMVALVGDTIIDGSIRNRLEQLRSGLAAALTADEQTRDTR